MSELKDSSPNQPAAFHEDKTENLGHSSKPDVLREEPDQVNCQSDVRPWCGKCNMSFATQFYLDLHRRLSRHHSICFACRPFPEFGDDAALRMHLASIHRDVYCTICNKLGRDAMHLSKHTFEVHFPCDCGKVFATHLLRSKHCATSFLHRDCYCKICDFLFPHGSRLRVHNQVRHAENADKKPPNLYDTLGLVPGAAEADIRTAAKTEADPDAS